MAVWVEGDLKASVALDEDVGDSNSLQRSLTLLTQMLDVQMSCTSTYVAVWSGSLLV
jgi:hypothetical protein